MGGEKKLGLKKRGKERVKSSISERGGGEGWKKRKINHMESGTKKKCPPRSGGGDRGKKRVPFPGKRAVHTKGEDSLCPLGKRRRGKRVPFSITQKKELSSAEREKEAQPPPSEKKARWGARKTGPRKHSSSNPPFDEQKRALKTKKKKGGALFLS